jgi:hypothetical protein
MLNNKCKEFQDYPLLTKQNCLLLFPVTLLKLFPHTGANPRFLQWKSNVFTELRNTNPVYTNLPNSRNPNTKRACMFQDISNPVISNLQNMSLRFG